MMKIIHLPFCFHPDPMGGTEIYVEALARELSNQDIINIIASIVVAGNVRRCLPKGSKVHTKLGLINIEDIVIGDEVLTSKGYRKVKNLFIQGTQPLIKINTHKIGRAHV